MQAAENNTTASARPAGAAAVLKSEDKPSSQSMQKPIHYPFWFGGSASSMAACVTHPLDLGK